MSDRPAGKSEFTGRHMLLTTVGFFGVILAVNATMATLATSSWTGLVVKNSYVASQEFETRRLAHDAQTAAGWRSSFAVENGFATLRVVDGQGRPVDIGAPRLLVNRPVGGHDDAEVVLERQGDGSYASALRLGAGVWEAAIVAEDTDLGPYALHRRFTSSGDAQ